MGAWRGAARERGLSVVSRYLKFRRACGRAIWMWRASRSLFHKETATQIEMRRQLTEAQVQRNDAERELQAAIAKAKYTTAHVKQRENAHQLTEGCGFVVDGGGEIVD